MSMLVKKHTDIRTIGLHTSMAIWVDLREMSMTKHSSARDRDGLETSRWLRRGVKTSSRGVCNERLCSPYETPDVPKLVDGEFFQSVGEVVCDADIVGI